MDGFRWSAWLLPGRTCWEDARRLFAEDNAKLGWTFEAASHFEAMSKYHQHLGRELDATNHQKDYEPYPDEWLKVQTGK